jgi:hypothetical protein
MVDVDTSRQKRNRLLLFTPLLVAAHGTAMETITPTFCVLGAPFILLNVPSVQLYLGRRSPQMTETSLK